VSTGFYNLQNCAVISFNLTPLQAPKSNEKSKHYKSKNLFNLSFISIEASCKQTNMFLQGIVISLPHFAFAYFFSVAYVDFFWSFEIIYITYAHVYICCSHQMSA